MLFIIDAECRQPGCILKEKETQRALKSQTLRARSAPCVALWDPPLMPHVAEGSEELGFCQGCPLGRGSQELG